MSQNYPSCGLFFVLILDFKFSFGSVLLDNNKKLAPKVAISNLKLPINTKSLASNQIVSPSKASNQAVSSSKNSTVLHDYWSALKENAILFFCGLKNDIVYLLYSIIYFYLGWYIRRKW